MIFYRIECVKRKIDCICAISRFMRFTKVCRAPITARPSGFIRTTANCRSGDTAREFPHTGGGQLAAVLAALGCIPQIQIQNAITKRQSVQWATTLCVLCCISQLEFCFFVPTLQCICSVSKGQSCLRKFQRAQTHTHHLGQHDHVPQRYACSYSFFSAALDI